ncbi:MAG: transposase family protein [Desulfoarculaceae bacterium]|nr:transposase family protein [Desulfoarculaceae bacterium]
MLSVIMRDTDLFQLALGLSSPWEVESSRFDLDQKRLDITLFFARGSTFTCPDCGQMSLQAHDTIEKTWRHLNFFSTRSVLDGQGATRTL